MYVQTFTVTIDVATPCKNVVVSKICLLPLLVFLLVKNSTIIILLLMNTVVFCQNVLFIRSCRNLSMNLFW